MMASASQVPALTMYCIAFRRRPASTTMGSQVLRGRPLRQPGITK